MSALPAVPFTRRRLLGGAALSFLGLQLGGATGAFAATTPRRAKRFIAIFSANGQPRSLWFPPTNVPFTTIDGAESASYARLADLPAEQMSTVLVPELNRFRDRLVVVRGLDMVQAPPEGHYAPKMLNGWPLPGQYRRSIDQVMAASRAVYATPVTNPSIHLRIQGPQPVKDPVSVAEVAGVASLVYGEEHADEAFRRLFASPTSADLGDTVRVATEKRVLDRALSKYKALSQDPRLGAGDRFRLGSHAALIDDLERRLLVPSTTPASCDAVVSPTRLEHVDSNMAQITTDHLELLAASIRCGLTRVATIQLCSSTDVRTYPNAEGGPYPIGHHVLTHTVGPDSEPNLGKINRVFARSVARLLELLDVVEEPDTGRTFLDNTIVYWGNEFGTNYNHLPSGFPVLLAGGKDVLMGGRYLDYRRTGLQYQARGPNTNTLYADDGGYEWRGRLYNEFLISLMMAMGLTPEDWERPLVPGFGDYSDNMGAYVEGSRRDPLPGLLA
jgi:hypothetical protein